MNATPKGLQVGKWPTWLYDALPYVYVAIGTGVIAGFGMKSVVGELSGVILISAGVAAFTMRRMFWREAKVRSEFAVRAQSAHEGESTLLRLYWRKEYVSGNSIIDEQHQQLFNLGSALLNAILENKPSHDIAVFLDLLLKDIQHHLHTEEKLLADLGHPITVEHKSVHEQLLDRARAMISKFRHGTLLFGELSEFITCDLIAQHIVTEDKQYFVSQPDRDLDMLKEATASSHATR